MALTPPAPRRRSAALAGLVWLAALVWPLAAAQAPAGAAAAADPAPAGCALLWQVAVRLDTAPRRLQIDMAFDTGPGGRSTLRLPGGWGAVEEQVASGAAARLQAVPGDRTLRTLDHAPGERVQLRWHVTPPDDLATDPRTGLRTGLRTDGAAEAGSASRAQLAGTWFALAGQDVLPVPDPIDERNPVSACVAFTGLTTAPGSSAPPAATRWASSHGRADGPSALFRLAAGKVPLRRQVQQALYAGGALDIWPPDAAPPPPPGVATPGGLTVVRPSAPAWPFAIDALAQATARAAADQQRFWQAPAPAAAATPAAATLPWLVLLLPGAGAPQASAWHQALALQAPADLALPGAAFDALLSQALVRTWVPDRFGPLLHAGRQDEALRAWFSDGFAAYFSHRLLLRDGRWTPDDYAVAMNRLIERMTERSADGRANPGANPGADPMLARPADAPARGEWLALQWHNALRAQGQPGLDAVLRRLLLPAAQARREGPISAPLATHRLLAALRPVLGDAPLRDINRLAEPAAPPNLGPQTLGPCFVGQPVAPADGPPSPADSPPRGLRYRPVAQALQQPACLAWLGLGTGLGTDADSDGPAAAQARVPARAHSLRPAHSAGRASGRPGSPSAGKKGGKTSAKSSAKSASKSANKSASKSAHKAAGNAIPAQGAKAGAKPTKAVRHRTPAR